MKLPHGESAIVDLRKIYDYCLSSVHPRGKHKARVFELVLGMTGEDSLALAGVLKRIAAENESVPGVSDSFGDRYIIDFEFEHKGRTAAIRSCWIILADELMPRFVTCWIL